MLPAPRRSRSRLAFPLAVRAVLLVSVAGGLLTLNVAQGLFDIPPGIVMPPEPLIPSTHPNLEIRLLGSIQEPWVLTADCEYTFPDRRDHEFAIFFVNYRATSGDAPFSADDWRVWIEAPDPEAVGGRDYARPYTRWAFISSPATDRVIAPWEGPCEVPSRGGVPELTAGLVAVGNTCEDECGVTGWLVFEVPEDSLTFIEYRTGIFQERSFGLGPAGSSFP